VVEIKWFVKMPDGDTYYGRIYNGKVYELIPAALPDIKITDGRAYVEEGPLEFYPGIILYDSDSNAVLADEGKSVLKYSGGSDNLGGYVERYYTATQGRMKATVTADAPRVTVDLDSVLGDDVIDREALLNFLSFIATALISRSISGINLRHPDYQTYVDKKMPIPVDKPLGLNIKLGRLPAEKRAGL